MDENPYRSPETPIMAEAVGVVSGKREDLRLVAKRQRVVQFCVLAYFVAVVAMIFVAQEPVILVAQVIVLIAGIVGFVFALMLASKVYESTPIVVLLAILLLLPCFGLIGLLVVNQKATNVLKRNGIKVGLLGADPNAI